MALVSVLNLIFNFMNNKKIFHLSEFKWKRSVCAGIVNYIKVYIVVYLKFNKNVFFPVISSPWSASDEAASCTPPIY